MVLGDPDCCAKCGHGEIWHPTCCSKNHGFVKPLVIEKKVILIGDSFYFNFPGEKDFPQDPKGWIKCTFKDVDGSLLVVKPKGHEKFVISRNEVERFSFTQPTQ